MKTFNEFLKLKENAVAKFKTIYGPDVTDTAQQHGVKGYRYYLNLFNQRAREQGRELTQQELDMLKQHRQNDSQFHQQVASDRIARSTQESVVDPKSKNNQKCSGCGRILGDYHASYCRYRKSQTALTSTGNDQVKPNHCK